MDGCSLTYLSKNGSFEVKRDVDGDQDYLAYLEDKNALIVKSEIYESLINSLRGFMILILEHLKYFYGVEEIDESINMGETYEWSLDEIGWQMVPDRRETMWVGIGKEYTVGEDFMSWLPWLVKHNVIPFFAFRHLHKAFSEQDTRHKWINATIAAELAFKEFLSKFDERTSSLIINVPSPPLKKLYKEVLMEFTGFESPMANQLQKGAERRNSLVHRANYPSPGRQETNLYVAQVQIAIFHLYICLYPGNELFQWLLKKANAQLKHVISQK
jgi:hypothetical protein